MRMFADVLGDLGGGETYQQLTDALNEVVQAVVETRKVGELTLNLKVKPNGETSVIVTDSIKTKVPDKARGETLFFTTQNGDLVRDDPKQEKLPLREIVGRA